MLESHFFLLESKLYLKPWNQSCWSS